MKRYILSLVAACGCSFILTNHTDIDTSEPNIYRKGKTSTSPYDEILQIIGRVCDADTYGKCLLLLNDTPLPQETQYRTIEILANTLEAYEDELSELTITHIFNKLKQKSEELHSSYPTNTLLAQHAQKPSETVDETKRRISREQEAGACDTANTPTGQSHELQELIPQEKKDATDPPLPSAEPKH